MDSCRRRFNVSLNEDAIREYTNQLGDKYDNMEKQEQLLDGLVNKIKISTTPGIYYVDRNTTISEIEDAFDIQIETEEGLSTVGDLVAYVEEKTK